ncbi:MAG: cellulase family glycosylhydrolase [Clostridia bacterium]|nr:cellulase family glycosylhydrolase [Clostridia bacterium]
MEKWSNERAWEWYNSRPWIRGCNYMCADCVNRVDQWQALHFDEYLKTTENELKLMKELGFNSVRLILEYVVWKEEHEGFLERFERYISLCDSYGISCMIVLANDCMPPKTELWKMPYIGEQKYDWGYHGGRKHSQHGGHSCPAPHYYFDNPESTEDYYKMVREIVSLYKDDSRILMWDLFNEPGNSNRRDITLPFVKRMVSEVRAINPSQPLTIGAWWCGGNCDFDNEVDRYALECSDIITYHNYGTYEEHIRVIKYLKTLNRPIINTEWLARCTGNTVFDNFPLFYLENIGCYNWGFVAGKYQTYEPYEAHWSWYNDDKRAPIDFTKWFHDLYRPSLRPYDPREEELIKKFCALADKEFYKKQKTMS